MQQSPHNLLRAAGILASRQHAKARGATIRRQLITVPARLARRARRLTVHLPAHWPWADAWTALFTATHPHPPPPDRPRPPSRARRRTFSGTSRKAVTGRPRRHSTPKQSTPATEPEMDHTENHTGGSGLRPEDEWVVRSDLRRSKPTSHGWSRLSESNRRPIHYERLQIARLTCLFRSDLRERLSAVRVVSRGLGVSCGLAADWQGRREGVPICLPCRSRAPPGPSVAAR
jgi:hypothetical protein